MWLDSDVRFVSARLKIWPLEKKTKQHVCSRSLFLCKQKRQAKKKKETEKIDQGNARNSLANKTPKEAKPKENHGLLRKLKTTRP